jgi:hypothetical protein
MAEHVDIIIKSLFMCLPPVNQIKLFINNKITSAQDLKKWPSTASS